MTDEEEDDSCLTRQLNESAVLKSIYGDQLFLLNEVGKPLECIIHLWGDSTPLENPANVPTFDLHVKCPADYPHIAPHIQLENWKKVPNDAIGPLREELLIYADSLKGEVLIHELAQHCEDFLYNLDTPDSCSLYDDMMQRNRDLEDMRAKELQKKKADEQQKREAMMNLIHFEQQAVRKALKKKSKSETVEDDSETFEPTDRKSASPECPSIPSKDTGGDLIDFIRQGQTGSRFESDFELIEKLGEGGFGEVWKARNRLDSGLYAIKKILFDRPMKQLKKITREVQFLSRLNHENVVRYYNSWVEVSPFSENLKKNESKTLEEWNVQKQDGDEDSDWICFSHGEEISENEESSSFEELNENHGNHETRKPNLHMYIQMELCENNNLRIAIDQGLYQNGERVWRLFREIVEGLCHIHNQQVTHRDLKPDNIFLGSNDQVKIGDFGLATTSKSLKFTTDPNKDSVESSEFSDTTLPDSSIKDVSDFGPCGTPMYLAPELNSEQAKTFYNQKVDIYSLGIIFFEMNHPPFVTHMERQLTLSKLRKPSIQFPENFPYPEDSYEYKMIRMMLSHDVNERPSSQDILAHDCLGTMKLDEGEVKDMVRRTLSNPQSKDYKFLVAACFNQKMPAAFEATYNMSTFRTFGYTSYLHVIEERLRNIFHHYGAINFSPPLLTAGEAPKNCVSLMTKVGGIVHLTPDLQIPFARYVVQNPSVVTFKRYALEKVYRERPVGIHPKELHECTFDIVSTCFGDQMPDIEIFAVIRDVLKAFPFLVRRNCVIHINHSVLISTLLDVVVANAPTGLDKTELKAAVVRAMTEIASKAEFPKILKSAGLPDSAISTIMNWIELDGSPSDIMAILTGMIKIPDLLPKCQIAIKQLQRVIKDCELLEMPCPVVIKPQLVRNPSHYTGILLQVKCDTNKVKGKISESDVLISGGRYDGLLEELKLKIPSKEATKPVRKITGFTINLEYLVSYGIEDGKPTVVDVLFCSLGISQMNSERLTLLKELWGLNIKIHFSNTLQTMEEINILCEQLGATLLLLMKPNEPVLRARLMNKESKNNEKKLSYLEVVDYVSKIFKQEPSTLTKFSMNINIVHFISMDKLTIPQMKIKEALVLEHMSTHMQKFASNVKVEVLVLSQVKGDFIKFFSSLIEPENVMKSMEPALKRYPLHKKLIQKSLKRIEDSLNANPNLVIFLYSLLDNTYKVLM